MQADIAVNTGDVMREHALNWFLCQRYYMMIPLDQIIYIYKHVIGCTDAFIYLLKVWYGFDSQQFIFISLSICKVKCIFNHQRTKFGFPHSYREMSFVGLNCLTDKNTRLFKLGTSRPT